MRTRLVVFARENWVLLVVILALVIGYVVLHERPSRLGATSEFLASLSQGKPTVVTFYSNF
jgi:hypothetical protein